MQDKLEGGEVGRGNYEQKYIWKKFKFNKWKREYIYMNKVRAGEMAPWVRALVALVRT